MAGEEQPIQYPHAYDSRDPLRHHYVHVSLGEDTAELKLATNSNTGLSIGS